MSTEEYADLGLMDLEPIEYTGGNFESMLAVATDPSTPPVEGLDVPDSDEIDADADAENADDVAFEDDDMDFDGSDDDFEMGTDDIDITDPSADSDGYFGLESSFDTADFDDFGDFGGNGTADSAEF